MKVIVDTCVWSLSLRRRNAAPLKTDEQQMVAQLLRLDEIPQPADAADALAIAICHLHTAATLDRQRSLPRPLMQKSEAGLRK